MYFTIAAIIVGATAVLWYVLTYNGLVKNENAVDQSWSNIEVELKRRFDLILNLVETAKGYAKHESETLQSVAKLRGMAQSFGDARTANETQAALAPVIAKVMVLAESYPQLRADQSFLKLQDELSATENRIAERRQAYNQTVNRYQNAVEAFPSNIVAGIHRFPAKSFFDAPDELAERSPEVKLS